MKKLFCIFIFALLIRLAMIWVWYHVGYENHLSADSHGYYEIAENLLQGKGFRFDVFGMPVSRRPPIYPLFIALTLKFKLFPLGVYGGQALLGAVSAVVLYCLAKEMFGARAGLLASAILSLDYLSVRQTVSVMPEILFVFFLLVCFAFLLHAVKKKRNRWLIGAGFSAGLALLTKDVLVYYFPLMVLWFLFWKEPWMVRCWRGGAFLAGLVLVTAPWVVRNSLRYQHLVLVTVGGGHTFYLANNPKATGGMTGGDWEFVRDTDYPDDPDLPHLYTIEADRYLFKKGLEFIRKNPQTFVTLMGKKIINMWLPAQTDTPLLTQWAATLCYLPVLVFGLLGIVLNCHRWKEFFPIFLLIAYIFLIHSVLVAHIRYRYPVMPFFMIFAAFTMVEFWQKWQKSRIALPLSSYSLESK